MKQRPSRFDRALERLRLGMWSLVGTIAYWCVCQAVIHSRWLPSEIKNDPFKPRPGDPIL